MVLGLRLAAYGLSVVFAALTSFAVLVRVLLRLLPAPPGGHQSQT